MAQQPTPLNPRLLVRKEDVPEDVKPPEPAGKMMVSYRPSAGLYDRLRTLSFKKRRSMQSLLDEAVEALLEVHNE